MIVSIKFAKASAYGYPKNRGEKMDVFVTAIVAIIIAIVAVLVAIFTKKKIGKIFIYAILGLIIGLPVGYILTPFVISFF